MSARLNCFVGRLRRVKPVEWPPKQAKTFVIPPTRLLGSNYDPLTIRQPTITRYLNIETAFVGRLRRVKPVAENGAKQAKTFVIPLLNPTRLLGSNYDPLTIHHYTIFKH